MSDDMKPEDSAIPPRVTIKVPGQSGDVSEAQTAATLPGNKKKTARISLDQTTAEPGATQASPVGGIGYASKTIRLAPAMTGQMAVIPPAPVGKVSSGSVMSEEAKRATSRIPLEAILSQTTPSAPSGMESAPKTIKVKRPTISIAPKVTGMTGGEPVVAAPPVAAATSKSQTARVDIAPEELAEPQQTQKKTIKIRRAEGPAGDGGARRMVNVARAEAAIANEAAGSGGVPAPHWIFPVTAAVAMLVLCFLIYLLSAQAFPNLGWSI